MDSEQLTISSLISELDDLTFVHAQSGLPITHDTRRTQECDAADYLTSED
jgi:hypothetical protein